MLNKRQNNDIVYIINNIYIYILPDTLLSVPIRHTLVMLVLVLRTFVCLFAVTPRSKSYPFFNQRSTHFQFNAIRLAAYQNDVECSQN